MRYYIKQKVFSLKAKFDVTDEHENVQYRVEGQMFSLKNRLTLQTIEEQTSADRLDYANSAEDPITRAERRMGA